MVKRRAQRLLLFLLIAAMPWGMAACSKEKKAEKPKVKKNAEVKNGTTKAEKGSGQSDMPLRLSCGSFGKKFNPFAAKTEADIQAVDMTQVHLFETDRAGQIVKKGIDGELREFHGNSYTYYGIANVSVRFHAEAGYTLYRITLRDDLLFSDGEEITIDDVIFSFYAFCDKDYKGPVTLGKSAIRGLEEYRRNKARTISGIRRVSDYEMELYTNGYDSDMLQELQIPVCPLHYYGDETKYNYASAEFGFVKGDLSSLRANQESPMGAGPYRFVKFEKEIAYYTANELYYKGCPKTAFLYLENADQLLSDGAGDETGMIAEIVGDTVDVAFVAPGKENLEAVMAANENGKLEGKTLDIRFITDGQYGYVAVNAQQVRVGMDSFSKESQALRKALATVISACRGVGQEQYENAMVLTDYPVSVDSWLSPEQEKEHTNYYALDQEGEKIYDEEDDSEEKRKEAAEAALDYLEAAGYTVTGDRVSNAPLGAELQYTVWIQDGAENPLYSTMAAAAEDLGNIGITLNLVTVTDAGTMQKQLKTGKQQIWCAVDYLEAEPDFTGRYGRPDRKDVLNLGRLTAMAKNEKLQQTLYRLERRVNEEKRKKTTNKVFRILFEQAVEIPVYQTRRAMLLSSERMDVDTATPDVTEYYGLTREIQNIEMKE